MLLLLYNYLCRFYRTILCVVNMIICIIALSKQLNDYAMLVLWAFVIVYSHNCHSTFLAYIHHASQTV